MIPHFPSRASLSSRAATFARALTLLALPLLAAGCQNESDSISFAPTCPVVEVPGEAADYYQYTGSEHDLSHLVVRAALREVVGSCEDGLHRTVVTNMQIGLHVVRGPASKVNFVNIPYFVAVVYNGEIKSKKQFIAHIEFDNGDLQKATSTRNIPITLPISRRIHSEQYHIEIGFQLTQAQLDFNRAHLVMPSFHKLLSLIHI